MLEDVRGAGDESGLRGYLWSAADILRGSIDSSDYKNFIFGLLFLKRLSDRFDEECQALVAGGHDPEDPDEHDFFVPKRARWSEIQKVATNIGETLNKACAALEEKNTALEGVLAGIDYNDERKLGDPSEQDVASGDRDGGCRKSGSPERWTSRSTLSGKAGRCLEGSAQRRLNC